MNKGRIVYIQDNNVEKGLRKFKKMISDSGLLQELRDRQEYVKPNTAKKIKRNAAKNRWKKYLNSQELPRQYY